MAINFFIIFNGFQCVLIVTFYLLYMVHKPTYRQISKNFLYQDYEKNKTQVDRYMQLYLFITFARMFKVYLGFQYIIIQKDKPFWDKGLVAKAHNNKEYEVQIEAQEYKFQEWNRVMRVKLEQFFRITWVVTISYIVQGIIVMSVSWGSLYMVVKWYTFFTCVILSLESWIAYCLLNIKIRDMRREWKRKKVYMY